jgi:hypothetical protein
MLVSFATQAGQSGDWIYGRSDDGSTFFAYTTNDSGAVFGEWCSESDGKCNWMIGLSAACVPDSTYPILANADTGAGSVMIACGGPLADTALSRYRFTNYKDIEGILSGSKRVGFAFPMQADQFRVVRFSLNGEKNAVSSMEQLAARHAPKPRSDTRDTVL